MCNPSLRALGKQSPVRWWYGIDGILRLIGDCFDGRTPSRNPAVLWRGNDVKWRLLGIPLLLGGAMTGSFLLSSCSPGVTPSSPEQTINVYSTQASQPWLTELFACAADSSVVLNITDPSSAEILLRIGEPENLSTPAYRIDTEEILIVTHRESPVQNLSLDGARTLFAGQGDPSMQVWVYDSAEDLQGAFDQLVMAGRGVTSSAKVATGPQQMSDLLNAEKSAVGILPKHWKMGDSRIVFNAGSVPVLAVLKSEPEGAVRELITCLQN